MAERITHEYRRLFEIYLLHHYWLDDGAETFDLMDQPQRIRRLLSYDVRALFSVAPTLSTSRRFDGLGCVFKTTALGCLAAVPRGVKIPSDTMLEIAVTVRDREVHNYTCFTLRPRTISESWHQQQGLTYRCKANVPLLSNLTGAARVMDDIKTLYLSREIPAATAEDKVEALALSDGALIQLTGDQPVAARQLDAQAARQPVFIHQGDVPAVVPPPGLQGAPARGIALSRDVPDDVFALIRLAAVRGDDDDFSLVDDQGYAKDNPPVFHVRFKNRSTVWKYFNRNSGDSMSANPGPLPLTHHKNPGTRQKPSGEPVKVTRNNGGIAEIVSEIFIDPEN